MGLLPTDIQTQSRKKLFSISDIFLYFLVMAAEKLNELINECTDKATINKNNNKKWYSKQRVPRKKWITSAIIKYFRTKETLYTFWKRNPDSETLKSEYRNYVYI